MSADFRDEELLGILRLREHPLFRPEMDVEGFLRELLAILQNCQLTARFQIASLALKMV